MDFADLGVKEMKRIWRYEQVMDFLGNLLLMKEVIEKWDHLSVV